MWRVRQDMKKNLLNEKPNGLWHIVCPSFFEEHGFIGWFSGCFTRGWRGICSSLYRESEIKSGAAKQRWVLGGGRSALFCVLMRLKRRARSAAKSYHSNIKILYLKPEGSSEFREQAFQHLPTRPCTMYMEKTTKKYTNKSLITTWTAADPYYLPNI
jgi:hypothetical protein